MNEPKINHDYLVNLKNGKIRIARFNGFGTDKGWGGYDWSGDTGYSTDCWMHDDVLHFISVNDIKREFDDLSINGMAKPTFNLIRHK